MNKLPEDKAIWAADQFIEYYSKFNRIDDYLRFVKNSRIDEYSGRLMGPEDYIFSNFDIGEYFFGAFLCVEQILENTFSSKTPFSFVNFTFKFYKGIGSKIQNEMCRFGFLHFMLQN